MAVRGRFEFKFRTSASFCQPVATQARGKLLIIHAVQAGDTDLPIQLGLREEVYSAERQEATRRIAELQRIVGTNAPVRVAVGSVKEALLDAALESDADVLMIGRSHHFGHCWPKKRLASFVA
jgi:nucleotide-binding universal stress UspA family protein